MTATEIAIHESKCVRGRIISIIMVMLAVVGGSGGTFLYASNQQERVGKNDTRLSRVERDIDELKNAMHESNTIQRNISEGVDLLLSETRAMRADLYPERLR